MAWLDLSEGVSELFCEAQQPLVNQILRALAARREERLQASRDYYRFVRTAPAWRARENAAISARRRARRRARAEARPPCPQCGGPVTRGAEVPRGRKLPIYCSDKCTRAARWARWYARHRDEHNARRRDRAARGRA